MKSQKDLDSLVRLAITEKLTQRDINEQLVRACQDSDPEAQRELYECYKAKVYSLAIYLTGNAEVAGDLTQEIFLKVYRDLSTFRFECDFGTWLYRLAMNTCLNTLRQRRKHVEVDIEEIIGTLAEVDRNKSPEAKLDECLVREAMRKAIVSLKPPLRIVVVLRYIENLSYKEIAEVLSCSAGTVAARLNRAHRLIERKLNLRH